MKFFLGLFLIYVGFVLYVYLLMGGLVAFWFAVIVAVIGTGVIVLASD